MESADLADPLATFFVAMSGDSTESTRKKNRLKANRKHKTFIDDESDDAFEQRRPRVSSTPTISNGALQFNVAPTQSAIPQSSEPRSSHTIHESAPQVDAEDFDAEEVPEVAVVVDSETSLFSRQNINRLLTPLQCRLTTKRPKPKVHSQWCVIVSHILASQVESARANR